MNSSAVSCGTVYYLEPTVDKNKLTELRDIGYKIPQTCGLCKHGVFVGTKDMGGCAVRTYEHLKHTGTPRQLSIYRGGSCLDKFELDENKGYALGAYAEFIASPIPGRETQKLIDEANEAHRWYREATSAHDKAKPPSSGQTAELVAATKASLTTLERAQKAIEKEVGLLNR